MWSEVINRSHIKVNVKSRSRLYDKLNYLLVLGTFQYIDSDVIVPANVDEELGDFFFDEIGQSAWDIPYIAVHITTTSSQDANFTVIVEVGDNEAFSHNCLSSDGPTCVFGSLLRRA